MRYLLIALCLILGFQGCAETTPQKPFPRRGPHRPIILRVPIIPPKKKACGKPTIVAVIDTGFGTGWQGEEGVKLCNFGHKDFTNEGNDSKFHTKTPVPRDYNGHGTHIASIIDAFGRKADISYCIVILKYYTPTNDSNINLDNTIKAIDYAREIHADFINYSGGGALTSSKEKEAVKKYIDAGGKFVAAAGNEGFDLANVPFYPAMDDDRVIVVGATEEDGETPTEYSNYGNRVNMWEPGTVISLHYSMRGTSQATAVATGKLLVETKNFCK